MYGKDQKKYKLYAHAKINLSLEVLGKLSNGYHEINSLIQTINLSDEIIFEPHKEIIIDGGITSNIKNDLIYQAVLSLQKLFHYDFGVRITLIKNIPVASGLGGGSSNAATVLKGLNLLWNLGLKNSDLESIGAKLGSDVPYFIRGGLCLVENSGEKLHSIKTNFKRWVVVCFPGCTLKDKTKIMYSNLLKHHYTKGKNTEKLLEAIRLDKPITEYMFNVFDNIAPQIFVGFTRFFNDINLLTDNKFILCGAGPSIFLLFDTLSSAKIVEHKIKEKGYWVKVARTV